MSASQHPGSPEKAGRRSGGFPQRAKLPDSRARLKLPENYPVIDSVADRTEYIATLMAEDVWNERTTRQLQRKLADVWGVSESTIRNYSTEAGRWISEALRDVRGVVAGRALERLEMLAKTCADSSVPGDAGAAVRANEVLLRATGYAEPEEDKQRPTTLVQVGQVVTSPVFGELLAGHAPKKLNGKTEDHEGRANGQTEVARVLPVGDRLRSVDGDPPERR